jgi:hypothetical protein
MSTPGALDEMLRAHADTRALLRRHVNGDWGDLGSEYDEQANNRAVKEVSRIFSVYKLVTDIKVWVITEADRSSTTFLLPSEY